MLPGISGWTAFLKILPTLFESNGLYFIVVFKGYHPLCGFKLANVVGNKLKEKTDKTLGHSSADFTIGGFIPPEAFIAAERNMPIQRMNQFDGSKANETHGYLQRRYDTMSQNPPRLISLR